MTEAAHRARYERLLSGSQLIESCLHRHLISHLNAEVVLGTVTDLEAALRWLRSTFLYVCAVRRPDHYGLGGGAALSRTQVEDQLHELCVLELDRLADAGLISKGELEVVPTPAGRLMARFCISFNTMRALQQMSGQEDLPAMLSVLAGCDEFEGVQLRTSDKRCLNALNRSSERATVRYPLPGRIKTTQMKINCLLQAALGSISIGDPSLSQDLTKICRVTERVMRCAVEYLRSAGGHRAYVSAVLLAKGVRTRLWPDSPLVGRQLAGVGPALAAALAQAGLTSLDAIAAAGGRRIEQAVNRLPPFGAHLCAAAGSLPRYGVTAEQQGVPAATSATVTLTVRLLTPHFSAETSATGARHSCLLVVGDEDNRLLCVARLTDGALQRAGQLQRQLHVQRASAGDLLTISYISESWVGLDVRAEFSPVYRTPAVGAGRDQLPAAEGAAAATTDAGVADTRQCRHHCLDKTGCAHLCCKQGVPVRPVGTRERVSRLMRAGAAPPPGAELAAPSLKRPPAARAGPSVAKVACRPASVLSHDAVCPTIADYFKITQAAAVAARSPPSQPQPPTTAPQPPTTAPQPPTTSPQPLTTAPQPPTTAPRSAMQVTEFECRQKTDHSRLDRLYGLSVSPAHSRRRPAGGARDVPPPPEPDGTEAAQRRSIFSAWAALESLRQARAEPAWSRRPAGAAGASDTAI
ncbi:putative ATP-dependent DNA helicase HFM1 [Amphibalanus amphitrite]|uniref:DNA 3'-5' helicase n=1 Tax=Amphibalanus amphitrite TaxID=1232801 RepID=A0A6A4X6L4_AMPAM|nr:putative ATP-dependent DNA helicase HFM1 [Amphibalanus amphitrite]